MTATEIRYKEMTVEGLPNLSALQSYLIRKGVKILDYGDVCRYQQELAEKTNKRYDKWGTIVALASLVVALASVGLIITSIVKGVAAHEILLISAVVGVFAGFLGFVGGANASSNATSPTYRWQWTSASWHVFKNSRRIPAAVYALGNSIQKETGSIGMVDYFREDPFLWFQDGTGRYYVAVWDEKGFSLPA